MNKKAWAKGKILFVLLIVVFITGIYFTFLFSYKCEDIGCFQAYQEKCRRTKFIDDTKETTWLYHILGKEKGMCEIEVEVLRVKEGTPDMTVFEGKSMKCYLPLGDTSSPNEDISQCHGILKEEIQDMMIKKLHSYVINNIGEISAELNKELEGVV